MTCDEAHNLICARLDGQIVPADDEALEAHLSGCSDCRAGAEAQARQHADLLKAFAPRRQASAIIADRVVRRLSVSPLRRWLPVCAAAAAGFLLALILFPPFHRKPVITAAQTISRPAPATTQTSPASPSIAQLALATGRVEILPKGAVAWRAMETGGSVQPESRVRTGPDVRCEFDLSDGSQVRLNSETEVQFSAGRTLQLADGQVWSQVAAAPNDFTLSCSSARIVAVGTRFDLATRGGKTRLVVLEGKTRVYGVAGDERLVNSGESVEMDVFTCGMPQHMFGMARAEQWIDEILVLKGRDNPELKRRIDDLMAQLGEDKLSYLYESEIRGLGDHCVVPLARYIQSDRSIAHPDLRHKAAGILSDSAQPWCIPTLIELLSDNDAKIRAVIAEGLARISGTTIGTDTQWREGSPTERLQLIRDWQHWWEENKDHISGTGGPKQKV